MRFRSVIPFVMLLGMFTCNAQGQSHTATLTWPANAGVTLPTGEAVTGYKIYRSTTAGGEGTVALGAVSSATVTSFTDTTIQSGQTYFYKYTFTASCDSAVFNCPAFVAESPMSAEVTTGKIPLPTAPALGQPTGLAVTVN